MLIENLMSYPHASNTKTWVNHKWFKDMMDHLVPYLFSPEGTLNFIWQNDLNGIPDGNTSLVKDMFREIMSGKDNKKAWLATLGISFETQRQGYTINYPNGISEVSSNKNINSWNRVHILELLVSTPLGANSNSLIPLSP